jgi:small-conductance mechanosensitive channel
VQIPDGLHIASWFRRFGEFAVSGRLLEAVALQLAVIALLFLFAWGVRLATRRWTDRAVALFGRQFRYSHVSPELSWLLTFFYAWVLLAIAGNVAARLGFHTPAFGIADTLIGLWIVLRASALLLRDALLARLVATAAFVVAALAILGLLAPTAAALDSIAINLGKVRLSLLLAIKAAAVVAILLWAALGLARLIHARLQHFAGLSPSIQVLTGNLIRIALVSVALLIGLDIVGIDLTAFTVFSGAVGVGIGFGLQKIVSNFVSGIILLLERSIKPGDVIEVGSTFGTVTYLGARYASVLGRDGKEYLIPNENLISNQVVNWSYTSPTVRIDTAFGVAYSSDLHLVRRLAIEVAGRIPRVLSAPAPACHVTGFGDSAVNLVLRYWIQDPENGVTNVRSEVLLGLWDAFRANQVELPFPQRELRIRQLPGDLSVEAKKSAVPGE